MGAVNEYLDLLKNFSWQDPTWDLFVFGFWVIAALIYAFASGHGRILTILMSVYISKLLVIEAPFLSEAVADKFGVMSLPLQQLLTFMILFVVLFVFLGKFAFKTAADGRKLSAVGFGIVFSFLQIGLLINIILNFLPETAQQNFTPIVSLLFLQPLSTFVWLILPIGFLVFLGKYVTERNH